MMSWINTRNRRNGSRAREGHRAKKSTKEIPDCGSEVVDALVERNVATEVTLLHAAEHPNVVAESVPVSFDGVAVHRTHAVPVVIARPLLVEMVDRDVCSIGRREVVVGVPLVRIHGRVGTCHGLVDRLQCTPCAVMRLAQDDFT